MQKRILAVPVLNFALAASLGLIMRFSHVQPIPIYYRYLTHAHSHVAMLGWLYLALFVLILRYFIPEERKKSYIRLFWITEIAVLGMFFSFPFQGYGLYSISFSTLHIICSFIFAFKVLKDLKGIKTIAADFIRYSIWFMLASILGILGVGPTAAMMGADSVGFNLSIQFFLHFQLNGWFIFAILALFFKVTNLKPSYRFRIFRNLLLASVLVTFALPVSWYLPSDALIGLNAVGIIMQFFAVIYLFLALRDAQTKIKFSGTQKMLLLFAVAGFILKILFQSFSLIPVIAKSILQYPNFVIGFIHLVMLGVLSCFIFILFLEEKKFVIQKKLLHNGLFLFAIGILSTELLILLQGLIYYLGGSMWNNYNMWLFLASIFLVLGIWTILIQLLFKRP